MKKLILFLLAISFFTTIFSSCDDGVDLTEQIVGIYKGQYTQVIPTVDIINNFSVKVSRLENKRIRISPVDGSMFSPFDVDITDPDALTITTSKYNKDEIVVFNLDFDPIKLNFDRSINGMTDSFLGTKQ